MSDRLVWNEEELSLTISDALYQDVVLQALDFMAVQLPDDCWQERETARKLAAEIRGTIEAEAPQGLTEEAAGRR